MSTVEPRKVWQVIRYIHNVNSGEPATQHIKTISAADYGAGVGEEEDDDSNYNNLIEEQDIISYDSESSAMESPTAVVTRPSLSTVLDQQIQVSPYHVITVNRPMVEDLNRSSAYNGDAVDVSAVNMSTGARLLNITTTTTAPGPNTTTNNTSSVSDEDLTSLTWLQDKNLIHGINLTTTKGLPAAAPITTSGPQTENVVTIGPNCDKLNRAVALLSGGREYVDASSENNGAALVDPPTTPAKSLADHASGTKTIAISELATKILSSPTLPQSISHLLPAKGVITNATGPQPLQHVHKKYRREEHVKISKQQHHHHQQPQQPQHHQQHLQLTPNHHTSHSPNGGLHSPYSERSMSSRKYSEESLHYASPGPRNGSKQSGGNKQKHPPNIPYNPFVHTTNKPPLSFSSLIFMAIENASEKALPVKEIYAWIVRHFPYFRTAPTGWKNSVRHNLSLNKCFQKVEKAPNMGKGSLWKVEQQYRQVLMQALTRSPYHHFTATMERTVAMFDEEMLPNNTDTNNNSVLMCHSSPSSSNISSASSSLSTSPIGMDPHIHHQSPLKSSAGRPFDPVLFPYLSKEISKLDTNNNGMYATNHYQLSCGDSEGESTGFCDYVDGANGYHRFNGGGGGSYNYTQYPYDGHVDNSTDNMDDVNAATAMLALKHGPKVFDGGVRNEQPVITTSPSEDHTYSAGNEAAEDAEKTNGTATVGSLNGVSHGEGITLVEEQSELELEEQRKKAEGVDALLNLAGFASNTSQILMKRRASSDMMSFSNESSMDCNSAVIFSSPSPTKRSKTRYLQSPVAALR